MDGEVGQAVSARGDAAGRAVGKPEQGTSREGFGPLACAEDAVPGDDEQEYVEVGLGVGLDALVGRQVDEVGVGRTR